MQYLVKEFAFYNCFNKTSGYVMYSVDIIKMSAFVLIQYKIDWALILCKIMLKMKTGKQS